MSGAGAKGAKIIVSGRLNGAEIARSEKNIYGSIPLHTIKANIDYSRGVARTTYGAIGIKVWIYTDGETKPALKDFSVISQVGDKYVSTKKDKT